MKHLWLIFLLIAQLSVAQNTVPYQIFTKSGKKVSTKNFLKGLEKSDIVLFGEYHDNPIVHWLQLIAIQHLNEKNDLILGAEMFETHQQESLNQYLEGKIDQVGLDSSVQLWTNYKTDYKPLVDFAKNKQLPFIATNVPRIYASFVYRNGLEALEERIDQDTAKLIAPLPIAYDPNLPGYKKMLEMTAHSPNPNFPKAQAIKDATMAHFIWKNYVGANKQFVHFNGDFHSVNFDGIYWYLQRLVDVENTTITTISTVEQNEVKKLKQSNKGKADFIIVVDKQMTKTH